VKKSLSSLVGGPVLLGAREIIAAEGYFVLGDKRQLDRERGPVSVRLCPAANHHLPHRSPVSSRLRPRRPDMTDGRDRSAWRQRAPREATMSGPAQGGTQL
jgi:hypothetical protein